MATRNATAGTGQAKTDWRPVPKIAAAGVALPFATILVAVAKYAFKVDMPVEVAGGIVGVIVWGVGFFKKDKRAQRP